MGGLLTVFALAMGTTPLAGQDLTLPADEGMHPDADFEMWSLLAHLEGESGSRLGIGIMFFTGRIVGLNLSGTFHLVADESATEWTATRDLVLPIFGSSTHTRGRLDEAYDRSRLWRDPASGEITALVRTDGAEIVLTFEPTIEPVDFGSVSVGEDAAQRIYTLPSGRVEGRITLEGEESEDVSGMAVFQHAWGDSPDPDRTGSQFSAHLDDGSALLAYHGERPGSVHVLSLARPDGGEVVTEAFDAEPERLVREQVDGVGFLVDWRLRTTPLAPEPAVDLRFGTTTGGQPVRVLGVPFWVGRCTVSGSVADAPVRGSGYVLLQGTPGGVAPRE